MTSNNNNAMMSAVESYYSIRSGSKKAGEKSVKRNLNAFPHEDVVQILSVRSPSTLRFASQFIVGMFVSPLTYVYARIVCVCVCVLVRVYMSVGVKFVLSN